jgi:WD40 repeat protein
VVLSAGSEGTLRCWELATGEPLGEPLVGHQGAVHAVAVGELEGLPVVVSGGEDGTARCWELATGEPLGEPLVGHQGALTAVAIGRLDGQFVVISGALDGTLRRWGFPSGLLEQTIDVASDVTDLAVTIPGSIVVASSRGLLLALVPVSGL